MNPSDLETVYETLAEKLDAIGAENRELFLAKLALLMSHELGNVEQVLKLIELAGNHIGSK